MIRIQSIHLISSLLLLVLPVFSQIHDTSKPIPDTPSGRRIPELIRVINTGDRDAAHAYINEHFAPSFRDTFPMEEHLNIFSEIYNGSRGYDFYEVRESTEHRVVTVVKNKLTESWEGVVIQVEPNPPHRVTGLQFAPARPPADAQPPKKLTDAQVVEQFQAHLNRLVEADAFSGAVLLAKDGKILFKGAYGLASKPFNRQGKLTFDAPIGFCHSERSEESQR